MQEREYPSLLPRQGSVMVGWIRFGGSQCLGVFYVCTNCSHGRKRSKCPSKLQLVGGLGAPKQWELEDKGPQPPEWPNFPLSYSLRTDTAVCDYTATIGLPPKPRRRVSVSLTRVGLFYDLFTYKRIVSKAKKTFWCTSLLVCALRWPKIVQALSFHAY